MNLLNAARTQRPDIAASLEATYAGHGHYQAELGEWIRAHRPKVFVETGVHMGFGSDRILTAMDDVSTGHLYSIDPDPKNNIFEVKHPRWSTAQMMSTEAMCPLYLKTGSWDVFLHDSDHEVFCTTFEYELAWNLVKPGGYILSDDWTWGTPPHNAWQRFCARHGLEYFIIGHGCAGVQKPTTAVRTPSSMDELHAVFDAAIALADAHLAEYELRSAG